MDGKISSTATDGKMAEGDDTVQYMVSIQPPNEPRTGQSRRSVRRMHNPEEIHVE
jgi:hypothetical protein